MAVDYLVIDKTDIGEFNDIIASYRNLGYEVTGKFQVVSHGEKLHYIQPLIKFSKQDQVQLQDYLEDLDA